MEKLDYILDKFLEEKIYKHIKYKQFYIGKNKNMNK